MTIFMLWFHDFILRNYEDFDPFLRNEMFSFAAHNISNTSSLSIAFNNDTYASVDVENAAVNGDKKNGDKSAAADVSYASVNPRTPRSRRPSGNIGNETYMSVQQQPEVLLKRSPVVRDVTTAHIASTNKLSSSESSKVPPPLPSGRSDVSKTDSSSGYKLLSSIPGAGRKVSQENKSTSTSSIEAKSGYKLLSSIPGAGKNVTKENKSTSCGESVVLSATATASAATSTANKPTNEKLTAPLTIIVPNISRAFARHNR